MASSRCPNCGARLDPTLPDCPECHHEAPEENLDEAAKTPEERARRTKWPIPWGLIAMLGIYFALVSFYTRHQYVNSPEYKASRHLRIAAQILGNDDGRTVEKEKLVEALDSLIQAIAVMPSNTWAQQRIEVVARRLEERKVPIPPDQRKIVDALGLQYRRIQDGRNPDLIVINARDIWDVDSLQSLPGQIAQRTVIGGLIIFVFWLYKTLQDRKHVLEMELVRQTERRKDLRDIARPKRRIQAEEYAARTVKTGKRK